jgi:hypothetical protein
VVRVTARRLSIPLALFAILTCASIAFFIAFGKEFPPLMTVHFDAGGRPDLFMDRVKFIVLGSFVSLMLPTFLIAAIGVIPRIVPPSMLAVPNKAYWTSPERRGQALDTLLWFGLWLACLVQAFLMVTNIAIYRANLTQPASVGAMGEMPWLHALLLGGAIVLWAVSLFRAFRIPRL